MAKVSTSGYEAFDRDFYKGKDIIVVNKTVKLLKLRSMLY
jgi:hypothetical protein